MTIKEAMPMMKIVARRKSNNLLTYEEILSELWLKNHDKIDKFSVGNPLFWKRLDYDVIDIFRKYSGSRKKFKIEYKESLRVTRTTDKSSHTRKVEALDAFENLDLNEKYLIYYCMVYERVNPEKINLNKEK